MSTDWKALCAELVHGWTEGRDIAGPMANARTALAQPEPEGLTDEEILNLSQEHQVSFTMCDGGVIYPLQEGADMKDDVLSFARALIAADRARWGRPAVEPETNGTA